MVPWPRVPVPREALRLALRHVRAVHGHGGALQREGEIHRVDPDFGSILAVSNRDSESNCWVN